jgi:hypothetical protein
VGVNQTQASPDPPDLNIREQLPYYAWMRAEGIPIHFGVAGISDITAVPRTPWARTGGGPTVREGGVLIGYEDEDPEARRYFIEANRRQGFECTMPPVMYRTDAVRLPT